MFEHLLYIVSRNKHVSTDYTLGVRMKNKAKKITFRLNVEDFDMLNYLKETQSINISGLLRNLIKKHIYQMK